MEIIKETKIAMELVRTIDLSNDKKLVRQTGVLFLLYAALGVGIIFLLGLHRDNDVRVIYIVLSCVAYIIAHELIHILFMLIFSREKVLFHFKLPYIAVGSNFYFSKNQFIAIALMPFIAFLAVLSILFTFCPSNLNFLLSVIAVLNVAGSSGDIIQVSIILKLDKNILIQDDSKTTSVYMKIPTEDNR